MTLGLGALGVVVAADRVWSDRSLADEWPPATSWPYLLRSAGLALASLLLVVGGRRWLVGRLPEAPGVGPPVGVAPVVVGIASALGSAVLLLFDPTLLNRLSVEDGAVEWLSALLSFGAAGLTGLSARIYWRRGRAEPPARLTSAGLALYAAAFVLLGLEEVSWFQRVLDVESPEVFLNRNRQGELNLHNLATTATGNAYFVGGFVFCVALPYLLADRALPSRSRWMAPLVPSISVLYATAAAGAIVHEMWNVIWIQLTFWMALPAVLLPTSDRRAHLLGRTALLATVITAAVFLSRGDSMVRSWDDTEVRELVIPYGFALYAAQVWRHASGRRG